MTGDIGASDETGATGRTVGTVGSGTRETDAIGGKGIDGGGLPYAALARHIGPTEIISEDDDKRWKRLWIASLQVGASPANHR